MFLKNKNIIFKIRRSKVTDYAALIGLSVGSVNKTTKLFADINIPLSTIGS